MSALHAVYRCLGDQECRWRGWVLADAATVDADSLPEARYRLWEQVASRVEAWPFDEVVEHTEHALAAGLWVREAVDAQVVRRGHTARVVYEALSDQRVRSALAALPPVGVGGIVVVACVPGDAVRWVADQHDQGGLVAATAVSNHRVWWNALVDATTAETQDLRPAASLTDLGLLDPEATVDDWMVHVECGQLTTLTSRARTRRLGPAASPPRQVDPEHG